MNLVSYLAHDVFATITLNNGKANAISHELLDELNSALDQAEQAGLVVVITGQPGMFSGGYDLKVMKESMTAAMALVERGSTLTRRLLAFPQPVISACSGHAVAKGAFILLASDYRLGVTGDFKIGLNEVAIGMTMHQAGIELAAQRMPLAYFNRSVICAEMFNPEQAVAAGFLDKLVAPEQLEAAAAQLATMMSKLDKRAHHQTKLKARADVLAKLDAAIELDRHGSL